jgi:hypothetical protein
MQESLNTGAWVKGGDFYLPRASSAKTAIAEMHRDVAIVRAVCEYTFGEVIEALSHASPGEAPDIAASVGMNVWEKLRAFSDVILKLAEATGDTKFFRNVAEHVVARKNRPDLGFPGLDEDALAYWRCVAQLWSMLGDQRVPPPSPEDEHARAALHRFVSLQQVLALLGIEHHNVSRDIQVAIASAYWSALVSVVPSEYEELVEDAWAIGQSEQSEVSGSGQDDVVVTYAGQREGAYG